MKKKAYEKLINEAYEITLREKLLGHPKNAKQGDLKAIENSFGANGFYSAAAA